MLFCFVLLLVLVATSSANECIVSGLGGYMDRVRVCVPVCMYVSFYHSSFKKSGES